MDAGRIIGIVAIMLLPTFIVGAVFYLPRGLQMARRWASTRGEAASPKPAHAPIEQLASDLRRLLSQHDEVRRSTAVAMKAHRLVALEGAVADLAREAASSLGVTCPGGADRRVLSRPELGRLLRALGDAGLVLPPTSTLLGVEGPN